MNTLNVKLRRRLAVMAATAALGLTAVPAGAVPITINGGPATNPATGQSLSASAIFDVNGPNLVVTLTNTGGQVTAPSDVLTAVFFDIAGVGALTPVSAVLKSGSTVVFGADGGGNVGGEWAYGSSLIGAPNSATEGISTAGFGVFGNANFNGPNLNPPPYPPAPPNLDGIDYGIISVNDNTSSGNAAVTGNNPLIQNSVVFTLSGLPTDFTLTRGDIQHLSFQYGTGLNNPNEPNVPPTETPEISAKPAPVALAFLAGSLLLVTDRTRRSRKLG